MVQILRSGVNSTPEEIRQLLNDVKHAYDSYLNNGGGGGSAVVLTPGGVHKSTASAVPLVKFLGMLTIIHQSSTWMASS